jgi:hypothetical protein
LLRARRSYLAVLFMPGRMRAKKLRGEPVSWGHRSSVKRILRTIATPVGRANTIGRPLLWKLRDPAQSGAKKEASR